MPEPTIQASPTPSRPRPVLVVLSILAAVDLVVSSAGFAGQVPARAAWWIITGLAAVKVGVAFYLQGVVTPIAAPRDARGVDLVPADTTVVRTETTADGVSTATVVSPSGPSAALTDGAGGVQGLEWTVGKSGPVQPRPDI